MSCLSETELQNLLVRLVQFDTPDPPGREIEIANYITEFLAAHGIQAELDEFSPGRANVLARIEGNGRHPSLVFSAHMDTMPPGTKDWRHGPYSGAVEDGRLYGRGTADMKSGLAAMIAAAIRVKEDDLPLSGDLILAFSGGESSNCLGAKVFVEQNALAGVGALLVSEPSSMVALTAEKGALWLELTTHGRSGHASGAARAAKADAKPSNAILAMMAVVEKLHGLESLKGSHALLGTASVSIGKIKGGSAVNLTPDICQSAIDIRFLPHQNPDDIEHEIGGLASGLEVSRLDLKPSVEADLNDPFVSLCLSALEDQSGKTQAPGGVGYFSDSCVLVPALNIPRVIIGPGELGMSGAHDEYVELSAVHEAAQLYHRIARKYL